MTGRLPTGMLLAALVGCLTGPLTPTVAQDAPKLPDVAAFDKLVVDSLREVHNRGADLYNTAQDFGGSYRMYQGGLLAVRPLLAHRPAAQKIIDEGIAAAEKEGTPARKAFKLHETIEGVRKYLKDTNEPPIKPIPNPKVPPEVAPKPTEKKPEVKTPEVKKPEEKKPDPKPVTPPEVKKPKDPDPKPMTTPRASGLAGKVTLKGQPLTAAEVTLVSLDQPKPRVFTATIQADGSYKFAEPLPPGRYVVIVSAKVVPEKYQTTTTSGLVIEVKPGATQDIDLK